MSRLITNAELHHRTLADLQTLYRRVQGELACSPGGSAARRTALASLENIARAMARLYACAPRPRI